MPEDAADAASTSPRDCRFANASTTVLAVAASAGAFTGAVSRQSTPDRSITTAGSLAGVIESFVTEALSTSRNFAALGASATCSSDVAR